MKNLILLAALLFCYNLLFSQKPRARDIGIPFSGETGTLNSITDVKGVEVGHSTIISGKRKKCSWKWTDKNRCHSHLSKREDKTI